MDTACHQGYRLYCISATLPWTCSENFCKRKKLKKGAIRSWQWQLRAIIEADLTTTWEVAQELNMDHSMVIWHLWSKLERWKSGCLMNWPRIKKNCVVFCYSTQQQQTISWSDCDKQWKVDFRRQLAVTSSVLGLRRSSKVLPKASEWASGVAQSCWTLCDPMDCSLPGSSVHGIFQARVLVWVAIAFSEERS